MIAAAIIPATERRLPLQQKLIFPAVAFDQYVLFGRLLPRLGGVELGLRRTDQVTGPVVFKKLADGRAFHCEADVLQHSIGVRVSAMHPTEFNELVESKAGGA